MANMTVFRAGGVQYAVKDAGSVHHSEAQQLSDAAKAQARANIDAADAAKLAALSDYVTSMSPLATTGPAAIAGADKAAPLPAEALTVSLAPVQEGTGTPSPENVRPIHGWTGVHINRTGVNIWDEEWETGDIDPNTGQNKISSGQTRSKNYILIKPNTQYYFCYTGSNNGMNWKSRFYDIDKNYIGTGGTLLNNSVFTTPADAFYVRFGTQAAYGPTYQHDISINYPPTDTEYHAYSGETYDIAFPSEAGEVYGGTLDVKNGVLTVDRAGIVLDGSVVGSITEIPTAQQGTTRLYKVNESFLLLDVEDYSKDYITNLFGTDNARAATTVIGSYVFSRTLRFRLPESIADTVDAVRAWLADNPLRIVYPLESLVTYQLTPQEIILLRGGNAVFADADAGDVTLAYRQDVALLLESLLAGQS